MLAAYVNRKLAQSFQKYATEIDPILLEAYYAVRGKKGKASPAQVARNIDKLLTENTPFAKKFQAMVLELKGKAADQAASVATSAATPAATSAATAPAAATTPRPTQYVDVTPRTRITPPTPPPAPTPPPTPPPTAAKIIASQAPTQAAMDAAILTDARKAALKAKVLQQQVAQATGKSLPLSGALQNSAKSIAKRTAATPAATPTPTPATPTPTPAPTPAATPAPTPAATPATTPTPTSATSAPTPAATPAASKGLRKWLAEFNKKPWTNVSTAPTKLGVLGQVLKYLGYGAAGAVGHKYMIGDPAMRSREAQRALAIRSGRDPNKEVDWFTNLNALPSRAWRGVFGGPGADIDSEIDADLKRNTQQK